MPAPGAERYLTLLEFALAVATVVGLRFVTAPYGRYGRSGWGPTVSSRVGWLVMECPAPLLFLGVYLTGAHRGGVVPLVLLALWELHYVQRAFVYPFLIRAGARMPLSIMAMAITFNVLNGYVNARWVGDLGEYPTSWLYDPRMIVGGLLFLGGLAMNLGADRTLRRLRGPGESGYKIPYGGAYRWVSSPNYLGEIVEWFGWALATWSLPGLAFAVYTTANLAPRAIDNHRWYRGHFPDYPSERRALLPGLL
ncbi:MAG TPA: methyltransferase [Rugosimonospora sp.]|nr:methyltransferase [Rugosimonospora sp.]